MTGKQGHRGFGHIRKLPSKRYQANYLGPDGHRYNAPSTFTDKMSAEHWLGTEHALVAAGTWLPPSLRRAGKQLTLATYSDQWLRRRDLKPRSRAHYRSLLDRQILPALGSKPLHTISSEQVRDWWADLDSSRPTTRAHAYGLLRTILQTAVVDEKITTNPCRIRSAGSTRSSP